MIHVLDTTAKSLRAKLGEAHTTNPVDFTFSYADVTSSAFTEGNAVAQSSGTTNIEVLAAPAASTRRVVRNITVSNNDTVSHIVYLYQRVTATDYSIIKITLAAGGWFQFGEGSLSGSSAAVTDGDKGDITVSSSGATWTIDNDVVTYAKMQNVSATSRILARKTASAGDVEEATLSEILDFIGSAAQGDILYRGASAWARLGAGTSGQYLQTQGAAANPQWATVSGGSGGDKYPMEFRLTLETGVPVSTTDQTAKTTIYCTPYIGNQIALYDGSSTWTTYSSAEFSLALGTITSGLPYDVFCYNNAGTPTLEFLAWTNGTTRATALTRQNGILVKSGATTRRYLGTFYTTSTTQTEDSTSKRFLYNYYNRLPRRVKVYDSTSNWLFQSTTCRYANNNSANKIEAIFGVAEDTVTLVLNTIFYTATSTDYSTGWGYDSATAFDSDSGIMYGSLGYLFGSGAVTFSKTPSAGYHYFSWLEDMSNITNQAQVFGNNSYAVSMGVGEIWC